MDPRAHEVRRLLDRYMVEIVEAYDLCPWARQARLGGEVGVDIVWGKPSTRTWITSAELMLAQPGIRVVMVVAPELGCDPAELREIRDEVSARIKTVGVAHFHPDAPLDLATPPRLVPYLRRSPDPLLQLVPLALLDAVRGSSGTTVREVQANMLIGTAPLPRADVGDRIAAENHARVTRDAVLIEATLADIRADRERSYARVGVSTSR